jgi:spermidine synthase
VSIFFLGLALGAWLGGRVFDRVNKILVAYAVLELSIGLTAFTVPWLLKGADGVLNQMPGVASLVALMIVSLLVLIVPTTLIGATFPAMAAVVRALARPTSSTGLFYGFNTLGAVIGCILVSLWWLPSVGLLWTNELLVLFNFAIAAFVLTADKTTLKGLGELISKAAKKDEDRGSQILEGAGSGQSATEHLAFFPAALLAGISGFASIAIEVLWVRALSLSYPGTVYVFAVVLAAYLIGIGVGSLTIGRLYLKRAPRLSALWWLYLMVALGCMVTHNLISHIVPWSAEAFSRGWITSWGCDILWVGMTSMLSMLPTTLAMGAALPLLIGLSTRANEHAGRTAGHLYSVNTLLGVVGSLAATFGLMPLIGLDRSLMFLALLYIVSALFLAALSNTGRILRLGMAALIALGVVISVLDLQPSANYRKERPGKKLLYYKDSPSATISVYEDEQGVRSLLSNNQYTQSTSEISTVAMQYRLGHIPMLLHPRPRRALLIGFATGATLAAMGHEKGLERLDCVEICDVIVKTASYFESINSKIWRDPRVGLVVEDGRRFLARPDGSYDVIVADLFFARNQGAGSLYSDEHFKAVAKRLAKGGIFVSWLPLWQLSPAETASIVRTYLSTFPDAEGWVGNWWQDTPILGLVNAPVGNPVRNVEEIERKLSTRTEEMLAQAFPQYRGVLPQMSLAGIGSRRLLDSEELTELADEAPVNSLDFPVIEFSSPRSFMEDKFKGRELGKRNLKAVDQVRSLNGTPWEIKYSHQ